MRERRDPAAVGALALLLIVLAALATFSFESLPLLGAGTVYRAEFTEAAGLQSGNEVRIAGVKVGTVAGVDLDGDHVEVTFTAKDAWIGDTTSASIQIKTIFGHKYLALDPQGTEPLNPHQPIPRERTTAPYDVIEAFSAAAQTIGEIDSTRLAESLDVLSQAFGDTSDDIRASLDGVTRLSRTVAGRDAELRRLLDATETTTQVLADRNAEFTRLITDAGLLLGELNNRQQAISQLLTGTQRLSRQLSGLVRDNEATLGPALDQLRGVIAILQARNDELDRALRLYDPFLRLYTNIIGNGRWFEGIVVNLIPPGLPDITAPREPLRTLDGN
ncbi:MCE family protein [Rhodococcus rhodochrous]|uniref:ABC transporter substrate-binding protein n=1 Tax=Rhodococcus rhodochrous KG-21 TaxID=1441923 RepID=A0A0M8PQ07_RHORH|nr:MCE family protein [Rhodococcus rhodochrous]KOS57172.1 ABC transporter substrate-binding protein [Rhodococcus rhodochrous KG-21]